MNPQGFQFSVFVGRETERQRNAMREVQHRFSPPRDITIFYGGPEGLRPYAASLETYAKTLWPDNEPRLVEVANMYDSGELSRTIIRAKMAKLQVMPAVEGVLDQVVNEAMLIDITDTTGYAEAVSMHFLSLGWTNIIKATGGEVVPLSRKVNRAWQDAMVGADGAGFFRRIPKTTEGLKRTLADFEYYYNESTRSQQSAKAASEIFIIPFSSTFPYPKGSPPYGHAWLRADHWNVLLSLSNKDQPGPLTLGKNGDKSRLYRNLRYLSEIGLASTQPRRNGLTRIGKGFVQAILEVLQRPEIPAS